MKKEKRSIGEVTEGPLFPYLGGLGAQPETEKRLYAVAEVLQRLPDEAYRSLANKAEEFQWFIPIDARGAMVTSFVCTAPGLAKVLYLPPDLESCPSPVVVTEVAHELAHIFLNHKDVAVDAATYKKQEKEVWRILKAWGFEKETRAHAKFWKAQRE
jgi:hypothetical protein